MAFYYIYITLRLPRLHFAFVCVGVVPGLVCVGLDVRYRCVHAVDTFGWLFDVSPLISLVILPTDLFARCLRLRSRTFTVRSRLLRSCGWLRTTPFYARFRIFRAPPPLRHCSSTPLFRTFAFSFCSCVCLRLFLFAFWLFVCAFWFSPFCRFQSAGSWEGYYLLEERPIGYMVVCALVLASHHLLSYHHLPPPAGTPVTLWFYGKKPLASFQFLGPGRGGVGA